MWEQEIMRYALSRAGEEIVSVEGVLKDTLVNILRARLLDGAGDLGVEKLTQQIFRQYGQMAEWMVRRIAQTETMISLAEAGAVAADTLDVGFTKQWVTAGIRTRETHAAMDGIEVDQNELFILADCQMRWPHDSSFGAPAGEIINCACDVIRRPK
jgi:hypothetical protein